MSMDPKNTQALCNKAVICSQIKNKAEANRVADLLLDADTDIPDELCRICLVLMELDRFEDAFGVAEKQLSVTPYDEGALHRYGVCAYETGRYDKAVRAYDKLCRIDPIDIIARYYRRICRAAQLNKPPERKGGIKPMAMNYQVPLDEMVNRINRLNELVLHDRFEQAEAIGVLDCIECGSCSYVCPAKRELALSIRMGKREVLKRRKARQ